MYRFVRMCACWASLIYRYLVYTRYNTWFHSHFVVDRKPVRRSYFRLTTKPGARESVAFRGTPWLRVLVSDCDDSKGTSHASSFRSQITNSLNSYFNFTVKAPVTWMYFFVQKLAMNPTFHTHRQVAWRKAEL